MRISHSNGFSLIELGVVTSITAILSYFIANQFKTLGSASMQQGLYQVRDTLLLKYGALLRNPKVLDLLRQESINPAIWNHVTTDTPTTSSSTQNALQVMPASGGTIPVIPTGGLFFSATGGQLTSSSNAQFKVSATWRSLAGNTFDVTLTVANLVANSGSLAIPNAQLIFYDPPEPKIECFNIDRPSIGVACSGNGTHCPTSWREFQAFVGRPTDAMLTSDTITCPEGSRIVNVFNLGGCDGVNFISSITAEREGVCKLFIGGLFPPTACLTLESVQLKCGARCCRNK